MLNKTDIAFKNKEYNLLNKGLKYNLHYKKKDLIQNLALEAENAINFTPVQEQEFLDI
jgi:hypothetical protein